jgi:hypothetical protein
MTSSNKASHSLEVHHLGIKHNVTFDFLVTDTLPSRAYRGVKLS